MRVVTLFCSQGQRTKDLNRQGDAVLMSASEYDSFLATLALLSAPGFKDAFQQALDEADGGATRSFEEVFG